MYNIHIYVYEHVVARLSICAFIYTCINRTIYVSICALIDFVFVCFHVYIYMQIYTYTHRCTHI